MPHILELRSVHDVIEDEPPLAARREVDPKRSLRRVIAKDIDGEPGGSLAEPNEPAPVLLVSLNTLVLCRDGWKQPIRNDVTAPTAFIDVDIGVGHLKRLRELQLIWHVTA